MKFNSFKLQLDFEFGEVNGDRFKLQVDDGKTITDITHDSPEYLADLELPTSIKILTSGKIHRLHTLLEDDEIVQDMYVKLNGIKLDGFKINENFLYKKINLVAVDGSTHNTNYFGFNGVCTLDFLEDNLFKQYLRMQTDLAYQQEQKEEMNKNKEKSTWKQWEMQDMLTDNWSDMGQ